MGEHNRTARRAEQLIRDFEDDEYEMIADPAVCLLCIAAPMYPVALILYTFVDNRLWLIFLWIAVMSTVAAFLIRCCTSR